MLRLAHTQTALLGVRVGGATYLPEESSPNLVVLPAEAVGDDDEVSVFVRYAGDAPVVDEHLLAYTSGPPEALIAEERSRTWSQIRARLELIEQGDPSLRRARTFFLRYDALTMASVLTLLSGGSCPSDHDVVSFLKPPPVNFAPCVIPLLTWTFGALILDRGLEHVTGDRADLPRAFLFRPGCKDVVAKLTPRAAVDLLAAYQRRIFDDAYPPEDPELPSQELLHAFTQFANGELRYASEDLENLNAEPDSAMFFGFAEFALLASNSQSPAESRAYWNSLFRHFVALGDVYTSRYADPEGDRSAESYEIKETEHSRRSHPLSHDLIRGHLDFHQARYRNRADVEERHAQLIYSALRDSIILP